MFRPAPWRMPKNDSHRANGRTPRPRLPIRAKLTTRTPMSRWSDILTRRPLENTNCQTRPVQLS